MLKINIPKPSMQIGHRDKILSIGSCFTEHIGNALKDLKFNVLQNPNGILFDPVSVCKSLSAYTAPKTYTDADIFSLNELWQSWDFHGRFATTDKEQVLDNLNNSHKEALEFLRETKWVIITLGSAFSYNLKKDQENIRPVANCHRAPAQWFEKNLLEIPEIISLLEKTIEKLRSFNGSVNFIFTISPVRHIRDGVIENNRSKSRLIEAVHTVTNRIEDCFYFPSYELVIDVLRDYRFYAEDLVHPNYLATDFVLDKFVETFVNDESRLAIPEIRKLNIAKKHRPSHPDTEAHKKFVLDQLQKTKALQKQFSFIDLSEELNYFSE